MLTHVVNVVPTGISVLDISSVTQEQCTFYFQVKMSDIAVAMILLALSAVVITAMAVICRVLGVWRLSSFLGIGEEKAVLTKNEHHYNAYTAHVS